VRLGLGRQLDRQAKKPSCACIAMAVVARMHRLTDREASSPPMTVELMRRGISIVVFVTR
jgi:hypothetical protein